MKTKIHSAVELKELFISSLINNTEKVSKVSKGSVLSGVGFGVGKVGNKVLKEIALFESRKFPSFASGSDLDFVAGEQGIAARYEASQSTAVLRVNAEPGTTYVAGTNVFSGSHGVNFNIQGDDVVVGTSGYAFISVQSETVGEESMVDANTILSVSPAPLGHKSVTNDFISIGGRDQETDIEFRTRIKSANNIAASETMARITNALMVEDGDILRLIHRGINSDGQTVLAIVTRNGKEYSDSELISLTAAVEGYFCIRDIQPPGAGSTYGVKFVNVQYKYVDVDFRVSLDESVNTEDIRRQIQLSISRMTDYRTWKNGDKFEWDDALDIVKRTRGVRYCPDSYFIPGSDIIIPRNTLPRLRQFIMRDLNGNIISDNGIDLPPIYFGGASGSNDFQNMVL